jgi:hypothetical protein
MGGAALLAAMGRRQPLPAAAAEALAMVMRGSGAKVGAQAGCAGGHDTVRVGVGGAGWS